jgi:calcineurin-like phosphoesterase family protein
MNQPGLCFSVRCRYPMPMTIWMISDTHFGEQPARRQKLSGFDAVELDSLIEEKWHERVSAGDTVWHLGDIGKDWRRLENLPGTKHLVLAHASDRRAAIRNSGVFASIQETANLTWAGQEYFLIHNPDQPRTGPAVDVIHGHHHYDVPAPRHLSVCVDHWGWGPVMIEDLAAPPSRT